MSFSICYIDPYLNQYTVYFQDVQVYIYIMLIMTLRAKEIGLEGEETEAAGGIHQGQQRPGELALM